MSESLEDVAARHGLSVAEAKRACAMYSVAREAAAPRSRRGWRILGSALVAVAAVVTAQRAFAAGCSAPGTFPAALGFNYFCANMPAVADDFNANTQLITDLVQAKVGALAAGPVGSGSIATTSVAATSVTAGVVTTGTISTPGPFTTITGNAKVAGQLDIGLYTKTCNTSPCLCNVAVTERALSWSVTCANVGHAVYSAQYAFDSTQHYGWDVRCLHVGTLAIAPPQSLTILCARLVQG